MENKEITLIRHNFQDLLGNYMLKRGYECFEMYRGQSNFICRVFRRIFEKYKLPGLSFWYNKKILNTKNKKIIVFESLCTVNYLKWLRKNLKNTDIIFWYWNIVKNTIDPDSIPDKLCEKWSFSRIDCKKYNMKFNPLPYFKEIEDPKMFKKYDVVFIGKDKGRLIDLLKIEKKFNSMAISTKFVITPTNRKSRNKYYSKPISYLEAINIASQGRVVLDYIEVDNSGQSLRIIESLFMKEKIITNSKLIKDYDFYCPENIFILGKDDINEIKNFINIPYKDIPKEIVMRYDFDKIIRNFFEYNEFEEMIKMVE